VCGAASTCDRVLPRAFLRTALEEFLEAPLPDEMPLQDYTMRRCSVCTLEFADPLEPAGDDFYEWLDREAKYHVHERWEWDRVEALVRAGPPNATVLEFGAGDAAFIRRFQTSSRSQPVVIERSPLAVEALRRQSIEAYAWDQVATALAGRRFDFVLAFHCVEHVPDPLSLVRLMRELAGHNGRVLFSVPYSPMFFETRWFDPLNHPPHHLSRWNATSLKALCTRAGGAARLTLPEPYSTPARARLALAIRQLGPHWHRRKRRWRLQPLLHPLRFTAELLRQARREQVGGRVAADVVLVEVLRHGASG
jgi:SAM-dependent methyltransferase